MKIIGGHIKLQYYFTPDTILENRKYLLKIKLNISKINPNMMIADFKMPVYSSNITAIPTVLNDTYGICNYLSRSQDALTNSINVLSRFSNVSRISLYVVSADENIDGNVTFNTKIGNFISQTTCYVSTEPSWVYITNTGSSSGEISINRISNNDTLIDPVTGNGIDCIILGIRVETE